VASKVHCFRIQSFTPLFISQEDVELLDKTPVRFIDLHAVDLLLTPVRRVDLLSIRVVDGGHLVTEDFNYGLLCERDDVFGVHVEQVSVFKHARRVPSENQNVVIASDSDTTALTDGEFVCRINELPFGISLTILISFNGVQIFFSLVIDSTEDVDKLISETARRVVMTGHVQVTDFPPKIHVNVVDLALLPSVFMVHSRSGND